VNRSDALAPLSRQHHQGLFAALKLKRADAAGAAEARAAFVEFWEREGREHFRVEEEVLLPAYARHGAHDHPQWPGFSSNMLISVGAART
jgi:hypothetical protein